MALSFSPITLLPEPPTKTSPVDFAVKADAFLGAIPDFQVEMNDVIAELNTITSGLDQQAPIAAWASGTTYNFPDVVAGSDGYSYRCITTNCLGVDPTSDGGVNWVNVGSGNSIIGVITVSSSMSAVARFLHIFTASCTLTLPPSPQVNSLLSIINLSGTTTPVVDPGAEKINGIAETMTMDILNSSINLMYSGATYGWIVI